MADVTTSSNLASLRGCPFYATLLMLQIEIGYFQGLLLWVFVGAIR